MNQTLFMGKRHIHLATVDSTNTFAQNLNAATAPEGTLVTASAQTAGRGQAGAVWQSDAGQNFTGSVVLYPHWIAPTRLFVLNQMAALAVRDTVLAYLPELQPERVQVKWPNDVVVLSPTEQRVQKIAGILIENRIAGNKVECAVVGIGLNVNQVSFGESIPQTITPTSILSLAQHNEAIDLQALTATLMAKLEAYYLRLRADSNHCIALHSLYEAHLYMMGQRAHFQAFTDNTAFVGTIRGVDLSGRLLVNQQTQSGSITTHQFIPKSVAITPIND